MYFPNRYPFSRHFQLPFPLIFPPSYDVFSTTWVCSRDEPPLFLAFFFSGATFMGAEIKELSFRPVRVFFPAFDSLTAEQRTFPSVQARSSGPVSPFLPLLWSAHKPFLNPSLREPQQRPPQGLRVVNTTFFHLHWLPFLPPS